jgi:lysophospholipase L1-like esterase
MKLFKEVSAARRVLKLVATNVLTWAVIFGVVFGAAEIGMRVRHKFKFGTFWTKGMEDMYVIDPKSGLRIPVPGAHFGGSQINSLGFRGPETVVPKPVSTVRVAFIGDSTTYCAEVSNNENAWPHLVAEQLHAKWPSVNVDYVNGGVPGYTARTSLRNLQARVAPLDPDIIVIYQGFNDMSGNALDLAIKQGIVLRPTEQSLTWPSRYSLLWYLVEKNLLVWEHQLNASSRVNKLVVNEDSMVEPFRRDFDDLVKASKRVTPVVAVATLSARIRREQTLAEQAQSAQTILYTMPYISVPDIVPLLDKYNEAILSVSSENGVLIVSDEQTIPGTAEYFHDSAHFSDKGSHFMAQRVSRELIRSRVVEEVMTRNSTALSYPRN